MLVFVFPCGSLFLLIRSVACCLGHVIGCRGCLEHVTCCINIKQPLCVPQSQAHGAKAPAVYRTSNHCVFQGSDSQAAEARARAARGALHWRSRLLSLALSGWQAESARLAIKRGKVSEADAFARTCRAARSLAGWMEGIGVARKQRGDKERVLREVKQQLGRTKMGRVLNAWREVHVGWVLKRFREVHAAEHWKQVVCARVVRGWRGAVVRGARKRAAGAAAAALWKWIAVGRYVFPAWRAFVVRARAKRDAGARAGAHRAAVLASQALAALAWYVARRRQKAADVAAAMAAHTRALQREGVEKWLRVGLWRREQRLGARAAVKVGLMNMLLLWTWVCTSCCCSLLITVLQVCCFIH